MKITLLAVSLLLLFSSTVMAANCSTYYCVGKVKTIYPHGGFKVVYLESEGDMSQLNCNLKDNKFITLKPTNGMFKEIYSMLLAAQMAQKNVTMRIIENSPDCELIYTRTNF